MNELYNEDPSLFDENRKNGENTDEIAILIRKDQIDEFITYVKKNNYNLNSYTYSIFETNSFLLKNYVSLIEYAAFFGSTQVFKYLHENGAKLTPSIWMYAIHSNNFELIKILEENNVKPKDETYHQCFYESIKCHHNELSLYIMNNFIKDEAKLNDKELFFKFYNFKFIEYNDMTDTNLLLISCKYNYIYCVKVLLEKASIDINAKYEKNSERKERMTVTKIKKLKTALIIALEKGSIDIAKLLLTNENIDVNIPGQYFSLENEDKKRYRKYDSRNSKTFVITARN